MSESRSVLMNQPLLLPIQIDDEKNERRYVNNLLQKTKSLVLSNKNYTKFMKNYLILTQQSSFKLPEITNYPILKNQFLIPISRKTYSSGNQFIRKINRLDPEDSKPSYESNNNNIENLSLSNNQLVKNINNVNNNISSDYKERKLKHGNIDNNNNRDKNLQLELEDLKSKQKLNNNYDKISIIENESADSKNTNVVNNFNFTDLNSPINLNNLSEDIKYLMNSKEKDERSKILKNKKLLFENELKLKSFILKTNTPSKTLFERKFSLRSSDLDYPKDYLNKNLYLNSDYKTLILDLLVDCEFNTKVFNYEEMIKNKFHEKSSDFSEVKKNKILEKLKLFINNLIQGKNENITNELKKIYDILEETKIELKISSLELEFVLNNTNQNSISNHFNFESTNKDEFTYKNNNFNSNGLFDNNYKEEKVQKIKIPFSIMPLFYYCKLETFYTVLAKMLIVNQKFYKANKIFDKDNNKEIKEHSEEGNNSENDSKKGDNQHIHGKDEQEEEIQELFTNQEEIKIEFETVKKVLESYKNFIWENENYSKDIINTKSLEWVSDCQKYTIKIHPPKIEFFLEDQTFYISKYIPKEMLIYFLIKNFINWDFYVLNYLSKYKAFRDNVNERFYKRIKKNKPKGRNFAGELFRNEDKLKVNDLSDQRISLSLDEKIHEPEYRNTNKIYFIYTNKFGETNFFILSSFEYSIQLKTQYKIKTVKDYLVEEKIHKENKDFNFKFNMDQLIKLQKLKKFYNLGEYLKKMVVLLKKNQNKNGFSKIRKLEVESLDNIKVDFDLKYFETLDDNFFRFLTKTDKEENSYEEQILNSINTDKEESSSINYYLR